MSKDNFHNLVIDSVYTITPKQHLSSEEIISDLDDEAKKYYRDSYEKFGVQKRFVSSQKDTIDSLGSEVCLQQISDLNISKDSIKTLIVVSQTSTSRLPNAGHLIHRNLELSSECSIIDINDGCNGYINALEIASKFIVEGSKIMIVAGDLMTRHTNMDEVSNKLLIGDAVSSTVLSFSETPNGNYLVKNDGTDADAITLLREEDNEIFNMDGFRVYSFAMQKVPKLYKEFLVKFNLDDQDFDHVILHQANKLLNSNIIRRLKVDKQKFPSSLKNYANTGPASIPTTISTMNFDEKKNLLFIGFGAGLSWGAFSINKSKPIIKIFN